jgi:YggT family protein
LNSAISIIFRVLAALVSIYTLLCFIRIILTWVPNVSSSGFARFLAKICDPYLNIFHGIKWLVIGSFDFSPALALCLLGAATTLLTNFTNNGKITVGLVLGMIITLAWSVASSFIVFIIILLAVRLIIILATKQQRSSNMILEQIDRSLSQMLYRISKFFCGNRFITYKAAIIIALVLFVFIQVFGTIAIHSLAGIVDSLPF